MEALQIWCENLQLALMEAIETRAKHEKSIGYTGDSALVAGWKETLRALEEKRPLKIKYAREIK